MTHLRAEKVAKIADSIPELKVEGNLDADLLIVGFGGTYGHLHSAMDELNRRGKKQRWLISNSSILCLRIQKMYSVAIRRL